jgi:hypothetical protein
MSNSDKIQWSKTTIQELQGRLVIPDAEIIPGDQESVIGAIEFPWPITIVSQKDVVNPDGSHSVQVIVSWTDVINATDYEVRLAKLS